MLTTMEQALRQLLADGHGCSFCDSGTLRNPDKQHDDMCGYLMAKRALEARDQILDALLEYAEARSKPGRLNQYHQAGRRFQKAEAALLAIARESK